MAKGIDELTRNLIIISALTYTIALSFMSIITDTEVLLTFTGLLPFFLYILTFSLIYIKTETKNPAPWWILPSVYPTLFLVFGSVQPDLIKGMDIVNVFIMNMIFSYIYNMILIIFLRRNKHPQKQHIPHTINQPPIRHPAIEQLRHDATQHPAIEKLRHMHRQKRQ